MSATPLDATVILVDSKASLLRRKVWLPRIAYALLPYFYFGSGLTAFLCTLYINEWFWVLPHYVLFSAACIHLGIVVVNKRRNYARRQVSTAEAATTNAAADAPPA